MLNSIVLKIVLYMLNLFACQHYGFELQVQVQAYFGSTFGVTFGVVRYIRHIFIPSRVCDSFRVQFSFQKGIDTAKTEENSQRCRCHGERVRLKLQIGALSTRWGDAFCYGVQKERRRINEFIVLRATFVSFN